MAYNYKIHRIGPASRSGTRRSLCGQILLTGEHRSLTAKASADNSQVTCKPCRALIRRDEAKALRPRESRDSFVESCEMCQRQRNMIAPPHGPSPRCESGAYPHCSCEICF